MDVHIFNICLLCFIKWQPIHCILLKISCKKLKDLKQEPDSTQRDFPFLRVRHQSMCALITFAWQTKPWFCVSTNSEPRYVKLRLPVNTRWNGIEVSISLNSRWWDVPKTESQDNFSFPPLRCSYHHDNSWRPNVCDTQKLCFLQNIKWIVAEW